eukprot:755026_1
MLARGQNLELITLQRSLRFKHERLQRMPQCPGRVLSCRPRSLVNRQILWLNINHLLNSAVYKLSQFYRCQHLKPKWMSLTRMSRPNHYPRKIHLCLPQFQDSLSRNQRLKKMIPNRFQNLSSQHLPLRRFQAPHLNLSNLSLYPYIQRITSHRFRPMKYNPDLELSADEHTSLELEPSELQMKAAKLEKFSGICSEILDFLFVGGDRVARDRTLLRSKGITSIVNCARDICDNYFPDDFLYLGLFLKDDKFEDISAFLYEISDFITHAKGCGGKVFVHCQQGVSRSCSVAIGYLMIENRMDFNEASDFVKEKRGVSSPNIGFTCQLIDFAKRRSGQIPPPHLYRMVVHRRPDGSGDLRVARVVAQCHPEELDPRGVFVLISTDSVFIWVGGNCLSEADWVEAAHNAVEKLQRYESLSSEIFVVFDAKKTENLQKFYDLIGATGTFSAAEKSEYDADYAMLDTQRSESANSRSSSSLSSDASDESMSKPSNDETVRSSAQLYAHPTWDRIDVFDPEDLDDDGCFVLSVATQSGHTVLYVWVGEDCELSEAKPDEFASQVGKEFAAHATLSGEYEVRCEPSGFESDEFWDFF